VRVLVLGSAFDTELNDRQDFSSVQSLFDYDIVVWETPTTLEPYRSDTLFEGLPTYYTDEAARLKRDLQRRGREFKDFLELGRTLVILDPAPLKCNVQVRTDYSGTGRNQRQTNVLAPLDVLAVSPIPLRTVEGVGSRIDLIGGEPFATFWRRVRSYVSYSSYFDETPGTPFLVVSGTKRAVGAYTKLGAGSVLILPAPSYPEDADDDDYKRIDDDYMAALVDLAASLGDSPSPLPDWASEYELPAERQARADLADAEKEIRDAVEVRDAAAASLGRLEALKSLITETGKPLEKLVRAAFEQLGCLTEDGAPGRTEFVLRWGAKTGVVEVKGVSKSAKEQDAAQLEKWVVEQYEKDGRRPKGFLVVNAYRELPLDQRTEAAFPNQMLKYSTSREHCLVTTTQLLGALLDAGAAKQTLAAMFRTEGVLGIYRDWREFLAHSKGPELVEVTAGSQEKPPRGRRSTGGGPGTNKAAG
jgi:hypothetical protein